MMTEEEKETFLALRGWQRNQDKLMTMHVVVEFNEDGSPNVKVDDGEELPNLTWDNSNDPTCHHKSLDEAMKIEGII